MLSVTSRSLAFALCLVTMLGWGSWANTIKMAQARRWPFALYYWDYVLGMLLSAVLFAAGPGSLGTSGAPALASLTASSGAALLAAVFSGALFNLSNVLIGVATDLAGLTLAFPIAVGLAVVAGTVLTYLNTRLGAAQPLFAGVFLLIAALVFSALASLRKQQSRAPAVRSGVLLAVASGLIMGFFYPRLTAAIGTQAQHRLTPYAAIVCFALGLLLSQSLISPLLTRRDDVPLRRYLQGTTSQHAAGLLGGFVWMIALTCNLLAAGVAGPAVSYALGQGATLVAALWGVVIWGEYRGASAAARRLLAAMFLSYIGGLVLIGVAAK